MSEVRMLIKSALNRKKPQFETQQKAHDPIARSIHIDQWPQTVSQPVYLQNTPAQDVDSLPDITASTLQIPSFAVQASAQEAPPPHHEEVSAKQAEPTPTETESVPRRTFHNLSVIYRDLDRATGRSQRISVNGQSV